MMEKEADCIMGFAGHMIDRPSRVTPRFPTHAEPSVREAIKDILVNYSPSVAVCSAACGGDIIFAELALELNIPTYVILPFQNKDDFLQESVTYAGPDWIERFHFVCAKANGIFHVNSGGYRSPSDFKENQHAIIFFILGYSEAAKLQSMHLILIDESQRYDGPGGTSSYLQLCKELNLPYEKIDMAELRGRSAGTR